MLKSPGHLGYIETLFAVFPGARVIHRHRQPRSTLVVGAGFIAVEIASIFAGLGTETTLIHRGRVLLATGHDPELGSGRGRLWAAGSPRVPRGRADRKPATQCSG